MERERERKKREARRDRRGAGQAGTLNEKNQQNTLPVVCTVLYVFYNMPSASKGSVYLHHDANADSTSLYCFKMSFTYASRSLVTSYAQSSGSYSSRTVA